MPLGGEVDIRADGFYLAHVRHPPHEHGGHGHNLVVHLIIIGIRRKADEIEEAPTGTVPRDAEVSLPGGFGPQVGIAYHQVIQVVERGGAENVLVREPEPQPGLFKRFPSKAEGGRQAFAVGSRHTYPHALGNERVQQRGGRPEPAATVMGSHRRQHRVTLRVLALVQRRTQVIVGKILRKGKGQSLDGFRPQRGREVSFSLAVAVVGYA